jgi:hypothetical protein
MTWRGMRAADESQRWMGRRVHGLLEHSALLGLMEYLAY